MPCWTILGTFWSKSRGRDGQNGQLGQHWSILCLDKEFANKFRSGGCMDRVSWQSGFFFQNVGSNIQIWPMANSKIVINWRLDPCLVKYGLPAGRSGVISVKNAQILKFLCGQKWGVLGNFKIKHLWGLSRVLERCVLWSTIIKKLHGRQLLRG